MFSQSIQFTNNTDFTLCDFVIILIIILSIYYIYKNNKNGRTIMI
jgi:hypothetical protein